jgi:hypothetical protein
MQSIESAKGDPILTIDNNLQNDKIKIIQNSHIKNTNL